MPTGEDDISNDVITLDACFSMFVYIRARFRFVLIGANLTAQSTGSHRGIRGGINFRDVVASPPSFSRLAARTPWRAREHVTLRLLSRATLVTPPKGGACSQVTCARVSLALCSILLICYFVFFKKLSGSMHLL